MAAVENIKSTPITNFDSTPPLQQNAGIGAPGDMQLVDGNAAVTGTNSSAGSTYQLCRLPANAIVKSVKLWLDAAGTTITGHCGLTFSTSPTDGTVSGNQPATFGGAPVYANTIAAGSASSAQSWFTNALALAAVVSPTEESTQATNHLGAQRQKTLWENMGLSVPPAGYDFDITFTLSSTAGSAAVINAAVEYVIP